MLPAAQEASCGSLPLFRDCSAARSGGSDDRHLGGKPTLFKQQLFAFLARVLEKHADLSFHVLTNGQHFDEDDRDVMISLDQSRILWGVPLYSRDPAVHDQIVGKPRAQERLLENLAFLCRVGASIELGTVLMQPNAAALPRLARFITAMLPFIRIWAVMQTENIGYGRMNWKTLFYDS